MPASASCIGGGQPLILACNARIAGGPSTGSVMPMAIKLSPRQSSDQKRSARFEVSMPSTPGWVITICGNRGTPALWRASGNGAS